MHECNEVKQTKFSVPENCCSRKTEHLPSPYSPLLPVRTGNDVKVFSSVDAVFTIAIGCLRACMRAARLLKIVPAN